MPKSWEEIGITTCDLCGKAILNPYGVDVEALEVCGHCWNWETFDCNGCGASCAYRDSSLIDGFSYCPDCSERILGES